MPRFYGAFQGFGFSKDPYNKRVDLDIQRIVRNAAREWLRAMIVFVPVWTGQVRGSIKFARGTNGNLARFLNVSIPINPIKARPNKNQLTGGPKGHYAFTIQRHVYRFRFRSDIIYYIHNEFFARTDPGAAGQQVVAPWHSLEAGEVAYRAAIEAGKARITRIQSAIVKTRIPIGL